MLFVEQPATQGPDHRLLINHYIWILQYARIFFIKVSSDRESLFG